MIVWWSLQITKRGRMKLKTETGPTETKGGWNAGWA